MSEDSGVFGVWNQSLQQQGLTVEWYFGIGHNLGLRLNCTKCCYSRVSDLRNAISWGLALARVSASWALRSVQGCRLLP